MTLIGQKNPKTYVNNCRMSFSVASNGTFLTIIFVEIGSFAFFLNSVGLLLKIQKISLI
jgi:hypothetical protein